MCDQHMKLKHQKTVINCKTIIPMPLCIELNPNILKVIHSAEFTSCWQLLQQ